MYSPFDLHIRFSIYTALMQITFFHPIYTEVRSNFWFHPCGTLSSGYTNGNCSCVYSTFGILFGLDAMRKCWATVVEFSSLLALGVRCRLSSPPVVRGHPVTPMTACSDPPPTRCGRSPFLCAEGRATAGRPPYSLPPAPPPSPFWGRWLYGQAGWDNAG